MIEAGVVSCFASKDQLASVKKCGHMGGKVLVPTQEAIQKLVAGASGGRRDGGPDAGSSPVPMPTPRI